MIAFSPLAAQCWKKVRAWMLRSVLAKSLLELLRSQGLFIRQTSCIAEEDKSELHSEFTVVFGGAQ